MKKYLTKNKKRLAFTLTEISIVLGIVGIVLSAMWTAYDSVHQQTMINTTMAQIMTASTNMRILYATSGSGVNGDTSSIGSTIFPADAVKIWNGGVPWAVNLWGDGWRVGIGLGSDIGTGASSDQQHFYIYSGAVPASICSRIVMGLLNSPATHILVNYGGGWSGWVVPSAITPPAPPCWPFGINPGTMAIGVEFPLR